MDRPRRLHDTLTVLLVPSLVAHPVAGAATALAWAWTARPPRWVIDARLLAPIGIAAVVIAVHAPQDPGGSAWLFLSLAVAAWLTATWRGTLNARDAGLLGLGASGAAAVLGVVAAVQSIATGFSQVHPGASHPNIAAGLGLALVGASAAAARLPRWGTTTAAVGIASALVLVTLTGSRGGWIGMAVGAVVVGASIVIGRTAAGTHRLAAATALGLTLVLLVGLQVVAFAPAGLTTRPADAIVTTGVAVDPGRDAPLGDRLASLLDVWRGTGGRVATWTVARQLVAERPWLGYGFASALPVFRAEAASSLMVPTHHPHNGALLVLLQGGAVLLTAVALLLLGWLWPLAASGIAGDRVSVIVLGAISALVAVDRFDQVLVRGDVAAVALVAVLAVLARPPRPLRLPAETSGSVVR